MPLFVLLIVYIFILFVLCLVMQYAATDLYNGFNGDKPPLDMPNVLYIIMGVGIVLKFVLWVYCLRLNAKLNSDTVGKCV